MHRLAFAAALALLATPLAAQTVSERTQGSATLQNVPEIPADIDAAVQRYQNYRSAGFEDWLADGSMLITTRFGTTSQVHRVTEPLGVRSQLTYFSEPVQGATAISGQNRFVLVRDTGGDEWFQIDAMGLEGEPARLTEPGTRNQAAIFSADGSLMVWTSAGSSATYTIYAADPADPASRRVVATFDTPMFPADISADGGTVLLENYRSNSDASIYLLDMATGEATEFAPSDGTVDEAPHFARNDGAILAITNRDSDFRRLVEFDRETGAMSVLTPGLHWDVEAYDLSDNGRILAYAVNEEGYSRVVVQDFVTRRALPQPQLPTGVLGALDFSPDGESLAIGLETATTAGDVWSWGVTSGELVRWTQSELGPLDPATLIEPELIRFRSFDGVSIPAFVYRPTGATGPTPVIIDIHGGPESQTRPGWNPGAQYFANTLGATVILPNVRGSDGYGTAYRDLDNGPLREDSVRDIGALLDSLSRRQELDTSRVAVYGQSYGGYMSLASMIHYSDRLVGGVERYGISDFRTFLENTESYRRDMRRGEYGDERDPAMAEVFARIAPMNNLARITRPMLVMAGANDPRVPLSESNNVVEGLREAGVPTWYVVFADEGHGFRKKPNNDLRRAVETLFLRELFEGN
ncbi:S9 family peptidase [Parasphingopyxis marina]|uniref:S9 family peptidase n=1 Tax=Parasphingopyxis marina TaxID=2761622 RepID=A0A842HY24_9SPHN|nr:prolyl oligopeptidase family serine peptidase [Parasphingopyxis marina]MBC2777337.1 S9 family peptidase [Parasphingopyxis marina]